MGDDTKWEHKPISTSSGHVSLDFKAPSVPITVFDLYAAALLAGGMDPEQAMARARRLVRMRDRYVAND